MNRAIFLDRDGVINKVRIENGMACSPRILEDFEFLSGVQEAIEDFKKKGYLVIVATNQPEISRGLLKKEELDKMHQKIIEELKVDDIMVCLHDDHHNCDCRKPKSGLLFAAAKKWNIDLAESFMVGDRWKDIEAGKKAGCKTILINNPAKGKCEPCFEVSSFEDISEIIMGGL